MATTNADLYDLINIVIKRFDELEDSINQEVLYMESKSENIDARGRYLSVTEYLELVPIGRATAYRYLQSGKIPSIKIGERILIPRAALTAFDEKVGLYLDEKMNDMRKK